MEKTSPFDDARIFDVMCIISVIYSLSLSYALKGEDIFVYYILMPLVSLASLSMFYLHMMRCQGWLVFRFKTAFGMPLRLLAMYILFGVPLIVCLYLVDNFNSEFPEDDQRARLLVFNMLAGLVLSLFLWFPVVRRNTAKADEYRIRVDLMKKGWDQEKIEAEIKRLRDLDLV